MARGLRKHNAEPLSQRSKARRAASYQRVRDAIESGTPLFNSKGDSLDIGHGFTNELNGADVTPAGRAFGEVIDAAAEGLESAANEVVKPDAVRRAPILEAAGPGTRAGRVGGDQGGTIGELRESAKVEMEGPLLAAISFNTIYAALQHERTDWHHTDGQAKYLEDAMLHNRDAILEHIAEHIRAVVGD